MYILYYKELHIVKETLTKNRTCQSWHGRQIAMCAEKELLEEYINSQPHPEKYYIEKQPERTKNNPSQSRQSPTNSIII